MKLKFNHNLVGSAMFLILSLVIWLMIPYQIVLKHDRVINSQTFPRLVIGLMGICSLFLFVKEIIAIVMKRERESKVIDLREEYRSILMILAVAFFWLILHWVPFMFSAILFAGLSLILYRCRKWLYYGITFSVIIAVTLVFQEVLHVNLP